METKDNLQDEQLSFDLAGNYVDLDKEGLSLQPKFSNKINDQDLFKAVDEFTEFENNLFFACIAQVNDKDTRVIKFSSEKMRKLIKYDKHIGSKIFAEKVQMAFKKFLAIQEDVEGIDKDNMHYKASYNLFNSGKVYVDSLECTISVNEHFTDLFNGLDRWTRFSLIQYAQIHSIYSKKIFRLLKQFRTTGYRYFPYENFKTIIGAPKSYQTWHIYQRIIEPAMEDLAPYFQNLSVIKIYKKGERGRKIAGYTFTWRKETKSKRDLRSNELLERSQEYYYIRTNDFLSPKAKFRAIDKFRGVKLGTTEKMYKNAHPATYFLDSQENYAARPMFIRGDLEQARKYNIDQLHDLIKFYEKLNAAGALREDDLKDLVALEELLLKKQQKKGKRSSEGKDIAESKQDVIAYRVYDFTNVTNVEESTEHERQRIYEQVKYQWASEIKGQDKRLPEIQNFFDK